MTKEFSHLRSYVQTHRPFFHFFVPLFTFITVVFIIFALFTYQQSQDILESEFLSSNEQDFKSITSDIDQLIVDTKYIIATLVTNSTMQSFYSNPAPETVWSNYSTQIYSQLTVLRYSQEVIEAVYLYSEASSSIYSSSSHSYARTHSDRYWLEQLQPDENGFSIFPYSMHNKFPHTICVAMSFSRGGYDCAVAILLNLSKVANLQTINENDYQNVFIVSDDGNVIYRSQQELLMEPLSVSRYLDYYDTTGKDNTDIFQLDNQRYAFSQAHSENSPWSYVLVTHLTNYSQKVSSMRALILAVSAALILLAVCFAFFFSMRSLRPLRILRDYLDSSDVASTISNHDNDDVKYIAARITQYMQSNSHLREELQSRLVLLNESQVLALQTQINPHFLSNTLNLMYITATDELGYDHPLPAMILDTSSLIRYAIEPEKMVTLQTELTNTDTYLSILKCRYNKALDVRHNVSDICLHAMVPRLFIQPIVENAIAHGFSASNRTDYMIEISCDLEQSPDANGGQILTVCVRDNGCGIPADTLALLREHIDTADSGVTKRIGLRNVVQRMHLIYADRFQYEIESQVDNGTSFIFHIPYIK